MTTKCANGFCAGLTQDDYSKWVPGQCLAEIPLGGSCSTHKQCQSTYCDAGNNTASATPCMPRGREGDTGDLCMHNTQYGSGTCNNLMRDSAGNWLRGSVFEAQLAVALFVTTSWRLDSHRDSV